MKQISRIAQLMVAILAQKLKISTWSLDGPVSMFVNYCQTLEILILEVVGVYS